MRKQTAGEFSCLYCAEYKPATESTCEHAIPQFLGGSYAPSHYKFRNVCRKCNNNLGAYVDGSYAKSWFVTNTLAAAARKYYRGPGQKPVIPLVCMGESDISGLQIAQSEVAESWLGPSGETVIWIRPNDAEMYWYTGGDPRKRRKLPSTVYFMPVSDDPIRWKMGVESFSEHFNGTKARRILGATVEGLPKSGEFPGFDSRTPIDGANVLAIRAAIRSRSIKCQTQMNLNFDLRFIRKMALGVGFSLFGAAYLKTEQAAAARAGLWRNADIQGNLRGLATQFHQTEFTKFTGYEGAVGLVVIQAHGSYFMSMTVDRGIPFVVELCSDRLSSPHIDPEHGYALMLFPHLKKHVELALSDLIAHGLGDSLNPDLKSIDDQRRSATAFWASLQPLGQHHQASSW